MADVRTAAFRRILDLLDLEKNLDRELDAVLEEARAVASTYASSRESVEEKGRRLLVEGRLTLLDVGKSNGFVLAECRGDTGAQYVLGFDPGAREWRCTCENKGRCSHVVALQLVTVLPKGSPDA